MLVLNRVTENMCHCYWRKKEPSKITPLSLSLSLFSSLSLSLSHPEVDLICTSNALGHSSGHFFIRRRIGANQLLNGKEPLVYFSCAFSFLSCVPPLPSFLSKVPCDLFSATVDVKEYNSSFSSISGLCLQFSLLSSCFTSFSRFFPLLRASPSFVHLGKQTDV